MQERKTHRTIEARRLNVAERTQKFLDRHPEFIPEPLNFVSKGFSNCASCGIIRPTEEMIHGCCGFNCAANLTHNSYQS
jgi:hypothetical protein